MSLIYSLAKQQQLQLNQVYQIFNQLIVPNKNIKIAVAVSGGSDSLCLAIMLNNWVKLNNCSLTAIIVDHKLRLNSSIEAETVKKWLATYNINTVILNRVDTTLSSKIQETARKERYKLLFDYCKTEGIFYLAVAHHINDLIETIIMREKRGKSLWGNSGMPMKVVKQEVNLIRPFLYYNKDAIRKALSEYQNSWIEDPSNQNEKFERVRVRKQLDGYSNAELVKYCDLITDNAKNRRLLEQEVIDFFKLYLNISRFGEIKLRLEKFSNLNNNTKLGVIGLVLKFCAQAEYMPKLEKLQHIVNLINGNNNFKSALGNCLIKKNNTTLIIIKEARAIKHIAEINGDELIYWDGRFKINPKNIIGKFYLKGLESQEYDCLIENNSKIKQELTLLNLNKDIILTLPWLFNQDYKPCVFWSNNIINKNEVNFKPHSSIINDIFYHFELAKM